MHVSPAVYKKKKNLVKEKEKSTFGYCSHADFFAHLWGMMGGVSYDMDFNGHDVLSLTFN